ncbi:MAG TPA: RluA family pseudouridine synthase [Coriobacteriia bacterium]|nr:RluA family pseudouridine synthase [Coriobacteriia bacterium]
MTRASNFEFTVRGEDAGQRLDTLLGQAEQLVSRSAAARLIDAGLVLVNGGLVSKRHVVRAGEVVSVEIPPAESYDFEPEDIPLDIRFEDDDMIVLSKQAGLVVHPAQGNWSGTLVHALLAHARELGTLQGEDRPGIVHRLDKDTTGLMMVAKNDRAQAALSEAIKIRAIDRRYLALVHGYIAPDSGLVDAPLGRDPRDRKRMAVVESANAQQAVTTFRVLGRYMAGARDDGYTLVECKLYTGRTHQIRVHMAYTGHAVVGDQTYGPRKVKADRGLARQFLHSYRLDLDHPLTGERLTFVDSLPEDLARVLREIEPDSMGRTEAGHEVFAMLEGAGR